MLCLTLFALSLVGCSRPKIKEAQAIAKSGEARFGQVETFYAGMIQHNRDFLSLTRLRNAVAPPSPSDNILVTAIEENNDALRRRLSVSRAFKNVYARLSVLAGDDTTSGVTDAFATLQTEVTALNHHPLTVQIPGVAITEAQFNDWITQLETDLVQTEQVRAFRAKAAKFAPAVSRFEILFAAEIPAYVRINKLYEDRRFEITKFLSDNKLQDITHSQATLETLLDDYGFVLTPGVLEFMPFKTWASGSLKEDHDLLLQDFSDNAEGLDSALVSQVRTQDEFLKLKPIKNTLSVARPTPTPPSPSGGQPQ